jgi:hypothetical protein
LNVYNSDVHFEHSAIGTITAEVANNGVGFAMSQSVYMSEIKNY